MYVEKYGTSERSIDLYFVPDVDHFDELNVLADTTSPLFNKTCKRLGCYSHAEPLDPMGDGH